MGALPTLIMVLIFLPPSYQFKTAFLIPINELNIVPVNELNIVHTNELNVVPTNELMTITV